MTDEYIEYLQSEIARLKPYEEFFRFMAKVLTSANGMTPAEFSAWKDKMVAKK